MSKDEIDIFDANLNRIGSMDRKEAHYAGHWHRTFHCWVIRSVPEPAVLFQRRAPTMRNYPGMLDVSAAGHLEAGEDVMDGVREIDEELGIPVPSPGIVYLGERVEVADQLNGQHNREYQSVYAFVSDARLDDLRPDPGEVYGVYWVGLRDGLDLFSKRTDRIEIEGIEYIDERYVESVINVDRDDFLPRIQRYYLAALISAERILEGKTDVAIS